MIRENLQPLYIPKRCDDSSKLLQFFPFVGQSRNHYMADDHWNFSILQRFRKFQNRRLFLTCQIFVPLWIAVLQIQEHKIRHAKQMFKLFLSFFPIYNPRCIETSMNPAFFCFFKQLRQKGKLQQRLSSCCRDSAIPIKRFIVLIQF